MVEKLTNGFTVSVRMTNKQHVEYLALAQSESMEGGEFIRHLIELRKEEKRAVWEALSQVFASGDTEATNTASHNVGREI